MWYESRSIHQESDYRNFQAHKTAMNKQQESEFDEVLKTVDSPENYYLKVKEFINKIAARSRQEGVREAKEKLTGMLWEETGHDSISFNGGKVTFSKEKEMHNKIIGEILASLTHKENNEK